MSNSSAADMRAISVCTVLTAVLAVNICSAHTRSESFTSWDVDDLDVRVKFTVLAREATRIPWSEQDSPDLAVHLANYLDSRLGVQAAGEDCPLVGSLQPLHSSEGYLRVEGRWRCVTIEGLTFRSDAFVDMVPSHVNFARTRFNGGPRWEYLFNERQHVWHVGDLADTTAGDGERESAGTSLIDFIILGARHILTGLDHLAFLLAIILVCRRFTDVVFVVTGFTVGHSIALALAVLGLFRPDTASIEALIGLTIALVATENISLSTGYSRIIATAAAIVLGVMALMAMAGVGKLSVVLMGGLALFSFCYLLLAHEIKSAARMRIAITALFGLIHGFGFAGALIEAELQPAVLAVALFGFNIGVELGQLGIVAALIALAMMLRRLRFAAAQGMLSDLGSAALCGLGLFWLVSRAYS